MKRPAFVVVVAAATATMLAGCPRARVAIEPPLANVSEVVDLSGDDGGVRLDLVMIVAEPNAWPLVLDAVDWELLVDDQPLARGRAQVRATIAANGQEGLTVRLVLAPGASARVRQALADGGRLSVNGLVHGHGKGGPGAASFDWRAPADPARDVRHSPE